MTEISKLTVMLDKWSAAERDSESSLIAKIVLNQTILAAYEQILNKSFLTSGFFRMTGSVGIFQNLAAAADDRRQTSVWHLKFSSVEHPVFRLKPPSSIFGIDFNFNFLASRINVLSHHPISKSPNQNHRISP
jgi:hypothetical protein